MARRSSARLRDRNSATPKRVSLSHDAPTARTPRTVPAKLTSLQESDEMPGAFPKSASPSAMYPSILNASARAVNTHTPTKAMSIKPSQQEMHPQLHHQTTAKPLDEARHLGFSNMAPHGEPPKQKNHVAALQGTPSKIRDVEAEARKPSYQFTFRREHSLELSPEAKKLMHEKREEAARIREQMIANGEGLPSIDEVMATRKMTAPKGRFSQAHLQQFEKMESIAGHASAFRADPSRFQTVTAPKSLKRSPSKARLDDADPPSRQNSREGPKPTPSIKGSGLPRSTSIKDLRKAGDASSPAKRVKRAETDDVSANRPHSSDSEKSLPATPKQLQSKASSHNLTALTTPTQASLARANSVKSTKSMIPAPQFTPAKASSIPAPPQFTPAKAPAPTAQRSLPQLLEQKTSTPLLARSPSKVSLFGTKPTVTVQTAQAEKPASMMSSLLARSPAKAGMSKQAAGSDEANAAPKEKPVHFLSRSPLKVSVARPIEEGLVEEKKSAVPFLSRSPSKLPMSSANTEPETPGKSASNKLLGRFNLLRQSPMKSILRSPQRLYSDDPSKVAAGTHMATPPGKKAAALNKALPAVPSATVQTNKRVDFSSSTKARDLKSQERSSSESKTPTPSPKTDRSVRMEIDETPQDDAALYPQLPLEIPTYERIPSLSPSPQKRRQTAGPQDFTFRADSHSIVFAQSPNAPASEAQKKRPSTIRYVSADAIASPPPASGSKKRKFRFENETAAASKDEIISPAQGSRKRKYEFENQMAAAKANSDVEITSDKENTPALPDVPDDVRPAKRVKRSAPSPNVATTKAPVVATKKASSAIAPTASSAARRTTLGVKPKGAKSTSPVKKTGPSTISQSRLAALSAPKKR